MLTNTTIVTISTSMHAISLQLCLTFFDPRDCSLPGSSVQGILQKRILEGVAMPSSNHLAAQPRRSDLTSAASHTECYDLLTRTMVHTNFALIRTNSVTAITVYSPCGHAMMLIL